MKIVFSIWRAIVYAQLAKITHNEPMQWLSFAFFCMAKGYNRQTGSLEEIHWTMTKEVPASGLDNFTKSFV